MCYFFDFQTYESFSDRIRHMDIWATFAVVVTWWLPLAKKAQKSFHLVTYNETFFKQMQHFCGQMGTPKRNDMCTSHVLCSSTVISSKSLVISSKSYERFLLMSVAAGVFCPFAWWRGISELFSQVEILHKFLTIQLAFSDTAVVGHTTCRVHMLLFMEDAIWP